jgi:hypothetical protein
MRFKEDDNLFDIIMNNEKKLLAEDTKFITDLAYASFFDIFDQPDKSQYIANLTNQQAMDIITCFEQNYFPLYMELQEYEKCARLKNAIDEIKQVKKIFK